MNEIFSEDEKCNVFLVYWFILFNQILTLHIYNLYSDLYVIFCPNLKGILKYKCDNLFYALMIPKGLLLSVEIFSKKMNQSTYGDLLCFEVFNLETSQPDSKSIKVQCALFLFFSFFLKTFYSSVLWGFHMCIYVSIICFYFIHPHYAFFLAFYNFIYSSFSFLCSL